MNRVTESAVLKACMTYLGVVGIMAWRNNSGALPVASKGKTRFVRFGCVGSADILGILHDPAHRGCLLAVEVKKPGGAVRKEQQQFLDAVRQRGGLALVVRSVADLHESLKAEGVVE